MYTSSAVSTFGWICALYKSSYFIILFQVEGGSGKLEREVSGRESGWVGGVGRMLWLAVRRLGCPRRVWWPTSHVIEAIPQLLFPVTALIEK
jgi:hypothetical protein